MMCDSGTSGYTKCLPVTYVVALIYIDRYQAADAAFTLNDYTVHR